MNKELIYLVISGVANLMLIVTCDYYHNQASQYAQIVSVNEKIISTNKKIITMQQSMIDDSENMVRALAVNLVITKHQCSVTKGNANEQKI